MTRLPVHDQLVAIIEALDRGENVLVSAPPGSGKSTIIPAALVDHMGSGKVLCSQPRRIAAQALAGHVAKQRGEPLGGAVGYAVRFDRCTGPRTRLEFITAGLLLRRLQGDPFLDGVAAVVIDEFHERSVQTDLALALLLRLQRDLRPELKLVVMSATMDAQALAPRMAPARVVVSEGRCFPVQIEHAKASERRLEDRVAAAAAAALDGGEQVLAFLPGVRSIEACAERLRGRSEPVLPLHGRLSKAEQNAALRPSDRPRVILATNIAETSLTIDGINCVIDSGLVRQMRFDPRSGLGRLTTTAISRAAAEQRAGRAGRTGPGRCLRLWSRAEQSQRRPFDAPELAEADLSEACLLLLGLGDDPRSFAWLEPPPAGHTEQALALLEALGARRGERGLSSIGEAMVALPLHPRVARMVVEGLQAREPALAARLAALASEEAFRRGSRAPGFDDDLSEQLAQLDGGGRDPALRRQRRVVQQIERIAKGLVSDRLATPELPNMPSAQRLLMAGFGDRLARRNDDDSYTCAGGYKVNLSPSSRCAGSALILPVAMRINERGRPTVEAALPVEAASLPQTEADALRWDPGSEAVVHERVQRLGPLIVRRRPAPQKADPEAVAALLFASLRANPAQALRWSPKGEALAQRLRFCRHHGLDQLPDPDDELALLRALCAGQRSLAGLRKLDAAEPLRQGLSYRDRQGLDRFAPEHLTLPRGRRARVDYSDPSAPVVAARVQDFFGLYETPTLADGRCRATCHLLAPNGRPAQVTQDLAGFWGGSYAEVRRALRGRYPKHDWPEDPRMGRTS